MKSSKEPTREYGKHRFMAGTCVDCGRPLDDICTGNLDLPKTPAASRLTETKLPSSPAGETAHIDPNSGKPHFTHTQVVPDSLGADISGPKGSHPDCGMWSGGAAPEGDRVLNEMVRDFTKVGPLAKSEVRRRIREYAESAAPIAPAAQEELEKRVAKLEYDLRALEQVTRQAILLNTTYGN